MWRPGALILMQVIQFTVYCEVLVVVVNPIGPRLVRIQIGWAATCPKQVQLEARSPAMFCDQILRERPPVIMRSRSCRLVIALEYRGIWSTEGSGEPRARPHHDAGSRRSLIFCSFFSLVAGHFGGGYTADPRVSWRESLTVLSNGNADSRETLLFTLVSRR